MIRTFGEETRVREDRSPAPRDASPPATPRTVLRGALPPARRFWWALGAGFASEASAVALLVVSAWLIVRASEQPPVLYLSAAVVGVRFFAISRAVFRYLERLTGHDAALRQLASTRADLVRRLVPLAPDGLARTRRGSVLGALVDDVDDLQNLPLRVVQPLVSSALVAIGAVVLVAFVWWPAALTLLACLALAALVATLWGWAAGARAERSIAPLRALLADAVLDHLGSLDVLMAFGAEEQSRARIAAADAALRRSVVRRAGAQAGTAALVSLLAGVASLAAVAVAAPGIASGALGGPWLAVVVLVPMAVFEVFASVPLAAASWRQVRASAERIAEALPAEPPAALVREWVAPTGVGPPARRRHPAARRVGPVAGGRGRRSRRSGRPRRSPRGRPPDPSRRARARDGVQRRREDDPCARAGPLPRDRRRLRHRRTFGARPRRR
nr:ABC transporter transmembrane domain-containing protein [Microbacterium yannicii]